MGDALTKDTVPATPQARRFSPFRGTILRKINVLEKAYEESESMLKQHLAEIRKKDRTAEFIAAHGRHIMTEDDVVDAMKVMALQKDGPELVSEVLETTDSEHIRENAKRILNR
ncbi:hypothetical protein JXA56_04620 [Candidatus Micrarchaeota archaeon]|nr:hypothetical protein [Candidatus Micrarchaeota archaeon]